MGRSVVTASVIGWLALVTVFSPGSVAAEDAVVASLWEPATLVHLLTPGLADALQLQLTPHFEVLDGREVILLAQGGKLFNLSRRQYMATTSRGITSLALSAGVLVTIQDNRLGFYREGAIRDQIELPRSEMRVVAGSKTRLYLYGSHGGGSTVYLLDEGNVLPLLEIQRGIISALTAIGERVFFAVDNVIYAVAKGEQASLVFVATGEQNVLSLVADPLAGVLYFSAGETVYAMRAGVAISILRGLAGFLRYSKNALFVLDPERRRLVKILGLEKLTAEVGTPQTPLSPGTFKE